MIAVVTIAGKTRVGRNHVTNHGPRWRRLKVADVVQFCDRPGPWFLLESLADVEAGKGQDAFLLWCHGEVDADHSIVGIAEDA